MNKKLLALLTLVLLTLGGCSTIDYKLQTITIQEDGKTTSISGNCATNQGEDVLKVTCQNKDGEVAAVGKYNINSMSEDVKFSDIESDVYEVIKDDYNPLVHTTQN